MRCRRRKHISRRATAGERATREILADPEFMAEILENGRALDRGEGVSFTSAELDEMCGVTRRKPSVRNRKPSKRKRRSL